MSHSQRRRSGKAVRELPAQPEGQQQNARGAGYAGGAVNRVGEQRVRDLAVRCHG
jgi:hypothetical protein